VKKPEEVKPKRICLMGASVGKAWNFPELPERVGGKAYSFEYVGVYQFDKSSALERLWRRTEDKPDGIILKECAAYFPRDIAFDEAKSLMRRWIERCHVEKAVPIPSTIAPVTRRHDERFKTHNPVKRGIKRVLGITMKTRMERIVEYNDWLRQYSQEKGLVALDLEAPLRIGPTEPYLRDDLTKGDGLHLNAKAYEILDRMVMPTLERIRFP
jgi:hypothetical protein